MNIIDRNTAKEIVRLALLEVADFDGEFEDFDFIQFQPFHKSVFLSSLKISVNRIPCTDASGQISEDECFDVNLSVSQFNTWITIKDCINHVTFNNTRRRSKKSKIQLP